MKNAKVLKTTMATVFGFFNSLFGVLTTPLLLMLATNLIDYATGLIAAKNRKQSISSYKSINGITKKITMWLLVAVGFIMDQLLVYAASTVGYELKLNFLFSAIVAIWIVCNEIISILENIIAIGVNIPAFLLPVIKAVKGKVETVGESVLQEESEEK